MKRMQAYQFQLLPKNKHLSHIIWYQDMAWTIAFLNQAPAQSLQQTEKALDKAFRDAFDKKQLNKKLPQFKRLNKRNELGQFIKRRQLCAIIKCS